jgi:CheY-like chemotaxis protein
LPVPQQPHEPLDAQSPAEPTAAAREPAEQRRHDKVGVLVVDDDRMVGIVTQLGLERNGFDVWLAADGREAIDLYREHGENIAIVVLDVRMPGLDGPQTLDVLRDLNPHVVACFITGDGGGYGAEELRQRGAGHVIAKPFCLDQLTTVLRQLLSGAPADLSSSGGGCQR